MTKRSENIEVTGPSNSQLYRAITLQMIDIAPQIGAKVSLLVPGNRTPDMKPAWNFRGALKGDSSTKPFYGLINATCDDFVNDQCWSIASLTIDGTLAYKRVEEDMESLTKSSSDAENVILDNEDATSQSSVQSSVMEESVEQPVAEVIVKPEAIWHTKTNNVNGRLGPGTKFDIAFKIQKSVKLYLLEEKENWGLFGYKAKNGGDGQIWISLRLVEKQE